MHDCIVLQQKRTNPTPYPHNISLTHAIKINKVSQAKFTDDKTCAIWDKWLQQDVKSMQHWPLSGCRGKKHQGRGSRQMVSNLDHHCDPTVVSTHQMPSPSCLHPTSSFLRSPSGDIPNIKFKKNKLSLQDNHVTKLSIVLTEACIHYTLFMTVQCAFKICLGHQIFFAWGTYLHDQPCYLN